MVLKFTTNKNKLWATVNEAAFFIQKCFFATLVLLSLVASPIAIATVAKDSIKVGNVWVNTKAKPSEIINYKIIGARELKLHIFHGVSSNDNEHKPALIMFHGGGWNSGNPTSLYDQADYFSKIGITTISVEYRTWKKDQTPPNVSLMDAKSAYRWVLTNAKTLNIDPAKIAAGGVSAGGHLAASLATIKGFNAIGERPLPIQPVALVLFNPVVDTSSQGHGYNRVKEFWRAISPIHNVAQGHPPTLTLLGSNDRVLSVATANKYRDNIVSVGSYAVNHIYPDKAHGFFTRTRSELLFVDTLLKAHDFLFKTGIAAAPSPAVRPTRPNINN
ncbi:alpha/beta hydrolase [Psychrosphaera sp. B3R10]|uniref:alpha/beta hydrolase n=1 Tax=unclassified Psychrosphaera TaxID=2641570 RepID=UPI001C0A5C6B|nr:MULTISPECIES: alpha/beta hydrolase [unclassified Psychrosphaera]MBU2883577.1 alpha/beta hydrolase [Psychrosphaera sp. I2R16]MBU2989755.1 alpha/beta hydrolase [Psychrosphaera sp. B3R10]